MLIIDENLMAIDEKLDELVASLLEHEPEVEAYRLARRAFLEDAELQAQLQLLEEQADYIAFRPELKKLQKELMVNEKVYQLRLAENDLQRLLSELAKGLAGAISEDILIDENIPLARGGRHARHGHGIEHTGQ
ncbi:YlbF family regulator [Lactococcus termiticola]|uniref:YlbF family regulator n=1 Tax=Lactococcus termiticola TaxID=2169526 RepID=A0A2R5HID3_9LACT|nr:YlbF family regulator [Lactococcus termiticola]GBG96060.1 hypothetical protein NtB2_00163 [Lactococcus termiticola]